MFSVVNDIINMLVSINYLLYLRYAYRATRENDDGGVYIERKLKRRLPLPKGGIKGIKRYENEKST